MLIDSPDLKGFAALDRQLAELGDPKRHKNALRAAVNEPMRTIVLPRAKAGIARISPGKTKLHRTYKGRMVSAGFAAASLRVRTSVKRDGSSATARLGVLKEAFYALQFFEKGTAYIPAQPWLVPAFLSTRMQAIKGVGDAIRARIQQVAKKR